MIDDYRLDDLPEGAEMLDSDFFGYTLYKGDLVYIFDEEIFSYEDIGLDMKEYLERMNAEKTTL